MQILLKQGISQKANTIVLHKIINLTTEWYEKKRKRYCWF